MAVPKRKTSPMKRGFRRSADALKAPTYVEDKDSGELRRPHHVDLKTACIAAAGAEGQVSGSLKPAQAPNRKSGAREAPLFCASSAARLRIGEHWHQQRARRQAHEDQHDLVHHSGHDDAPPAISPS